MKTKIFGIITMLLTAGVLVITGCTPEEEQPPKFADLTAAADNASLAAVFTEAVYKMNNKTGNLDATAFNVTITGGVATLTSFTVTHTAGTAQATINLVLKGVANGQETVTVTPKTSTSIYNGAAVAMETTQIKTVKLKDTGIIGRWYSSKTNVAALLRAAGIDSIYALFRADNTYLVESFTAALSKTTMTGVYVQARSTVGTIWNITVNQSTPTTLTSVGIFETAVSGALTTMRYEVAQTVPSITGVTPPTAAAGFGSTSGGAYSTWNIQTYIKMN